MDNLKCNFLQKIKTKKTWCLFFGFLIIFILAIINIFHLPLPGFNKGEIQRGLDPEPLIDISQISGLREIYTAAADMIPTSLCLSAKALATADEGEGQGVRCKAVDEKSGSEGMNGEEIKSAILPHHTLLASQLAEHWQKIIENNPEPSVIVVVGAAHENQGDALIQTTSNDYQTDFGIVKTSDEIVSTLVSSGIVKDEPSSFDNEHSVGTFIPFIAKTFPDVPIVPIIAKSKAGEKEARALVSTLEQNLPADALIIFSLDFSHGLATEAAFKNDETVRQLMNFRDYGKIDVLNETFLDSPFVLDSFLLWSEKNNWDNELIWHSHSGEVTGETNEPGTSYMIFFAPAREKPFMISLVGDVMLSRAVGGKLKRVSVDEAFSKIAPSLANSDLVFANLESVLSTSTMESSKEIRFKADPARIDVLNYFGMTHVSVTNNHIGDYGRAAWDESLIYLKAGGVEPVGGYGNDGAPVFAEAAGQRLAFLAFDTTIWKMATTTLTEIISPLKNQADLILVSFHWGNEYQHKPTSQQVELAHAAIDAGADVIIGHHPHVLEGIEKYKDGLIFYSLGNFIFDQFGEDENESLVVRLGWNGEEKSVELLPAKIDGYFPRPATEEEYSAALERLASWSDESLQEEIKNGVVNW
ncbi:MAG: AmmeMemoRadiSam system protein B [Candidatus Uhrbacteria bacterium]